MSDFDYGRVKENGQYENYPCDVKPAFVAPIRDEYYHPKCGTRTIMRGGCLYNTYATNPSYYGSTFCVGCQVHLPVAEFVWCERGRITDIKVGEVAGEPGKDLRH